MRAAILTAIVLGLCGSTWATVIFEDNFESGDFSSPSGQGASWVAYPATPTGNLSTTVQSSVSLSGTYSAELHDADGGGASSLVGVYDTTDGASLIELTFKARVDDSPTTNNNYMQLRNGFTAIVRIRWYNDTNLQYQTSAGGYANITTYTPGIEQDMKIVVNEAASTFSLWVDGNELLTDAACASSASGGMNRLEFNSGIVASSQMDFYVDDARLAVVPEPATMVLLTLGAAGWLIRRRR